MASEEEFTSDSLDTTETDLPEALLGYVRDQVVDYIKQTKFSAKIQHTEGQSPKLVLSFGNLARQNGKSMSKYEFVVFLKLFGFHEETTDYHNVRVFV